MKIKNIPTDVSLKILINKNKVQCSTIYLGKIKSFELDRRTYCHVSERVVSLGLGGLGFFALFCFVAIVLFYH